MNSFEQEPTKDLIADSHVLIGPYIHRSPILTCKTINDLTGASLFFKCENFQKVGAFKFRGGIHALLRLSHEARAKGVATHSSGNHAQAVALAAKLCDTQAYIVMPNNAPKVKQQAVAGYGAKITFCEPTLQAREDTLARVVKETGATCIHPYDDYRVITGQATCAKELIEDVSGLDQIITPVGGGGLLAGTILSAKHFASHIEVYAEGADDAWQSLQKGELVPQTSPKTIADGLLTSLGDRNFKIIKRDVADIFRVNDEEIIAAMRLIWERMKIIIEPSCAVPLAAIIKNKMTFADKRVGVILTGGNVDLGNLPF